MNLNMRNGRIVIDGREFRGNNVTINNGKVTVDGETISDTVIEPVNEELAEMTRLLVKAELGIEEPMALHLITHYR